MSKPPDNMSPELAEAFEECRKAGVREAARLIADVFEVKDSEFFNGIWRTVDDEGWGLLNQAERSFKASILRYLAKHLGEDPVPINKAREKELKEKFERIERERRMRDWFGGKSS